MRNTHKLVMLSSNENCYVTHALLKFVIPQKKKRKSQPAERERGREEKTFIVMLRRVLSKQHKRRTGTNVN